MEFLNEIIAGKKKQLASIELDMGYWNLLLEGKDEDELRNDLAGERTRKKSEQNPTMLNELSQKIGEIEKSQEEIRKLEQMKGSIQQYISYIENLSDEKKKELEEILK